MGNAVHKHHKFSSVCVCVAGVCEASAGPSQMFVSTDVQQRAVPLRFHVSGSALAVHALHHRGAVAEAPAVPARSCSGAQPVFTAVPVHRAAGTTSSCGTDPV